MEFLDAAGTFPVVDVRTPSEYARGHIPEAYNIPLFSDQERKNIGTTFKLSGQQDAVVMGLEYAGPKMKKLALQASGIAVRKQLLVHCWRGGMRSASMAWLFGTVGLQSFLLEGGYKSFRRHVLESFDRDYPFVVIGGLTGSGKTEVLKMLKEMGEQVIDLEKMARHKGSAFGGLGQPVQPTNEQFENDLFHELRGLSKNRIIWIEDESRNIGRNTLPGGIHRNLRSAPMFFLDVPAGSRIERLVRDYASFGTDDLIQAVDRIRPRLGDQVARAAIEGIREGDFQKTAELVLHYYDKTYRFGLSRREKKKVFSISFEDASSSSEIAENLLIHAGPMLPELSRG